MTVKPESLENAERDLELLTRDVKGGKKATAIAAGSAEEELMALRQRIAAAMTLTPEAPIPECRDCYRRGWQAALRSLEESQRR